MQAILTKILLTLLLCSTAMPFTIRAMTIEILESSDVNKVENAIEQGACVNQQIDRRTPLSCAIRNGRQKTVRSLLKSKANPNYSNDYDGNFPLHEAAGKGSPSIVRRLIKNGADVNKRNNQKATAQDNAQSLYNEITVRVFPSSVESPKQERAIKLLKCSQIILLLTDNSEKAKLSTNDSNKLHCECGTELSTNTLEEYINEDEEEERLQYRMHRLLKKIYFKFSLINSIMLLSGVILLNQLFILIK